MMYMSDHFDYVMMNAAHVAQEAEANYQKNLGDWYNANMKFTMPNIERGYFAVLNAIANDINKSRREIVKHIKNDVAFNRGWYSDVFYRLKKAELISYNKIDGYVLTKFGNEYYKQVMKALFN